MNLIHVWPISTQKSLFRHTKSLGRKMNFWGQKWLFRHKNDHFGLKIATSRKSTFRHKNGYLDTLFFLFCSTRNYRGSTHVFPVAVRSEMVRFFTASMLERYLPWPFTIISNGSSGNSELNGRFRSITRLNPALFSGCFQIRFRGVSVVLAGMSVTITTKSIIFAAEFVINRAVRPFHHTPTHSPLFSASATGVTCRITVRIPFIFDPTVTVTSLGVTSINSCSSTVTWSRIDLSVGSLNLTASSRGSLAAAAGFWAFGVTETGPFEFFTRSTAAGHRFVWKSRTSSRTYFRYRKTLC